MQTADKLILLEMIKENKDTLFGSFNRNITRESKNSTWKIIYDKCRARGINVGKDYVYLRDTIWQNLRRSTVTKVDKRNQTGGEGGRSLELTDIDNAVLDTIGKDNPVISGLDVTETGDVPETSTPNPTPRPTSVKRPLQDLNGRPSSKKARTDFKSVYEAKKLKKMDLEIEKLKLEVFILRKKVGEFTTSLILSDVDDE